MVKTMCGDLLDDDPAVRTTVQRWLNGGDALALRHAYTDVDSALHGLAHGLPDLLLVEINIRNGYGLELLRKIRHRHPELRILVLSLLDEHLYAERVLRIGARGYVMKSAGPETFRVATETILADQLYVSSAVELRILREIAQQEDGEQLSPEKLLSNREFEVFVKIAEGHTSRKIAADLGLSIKTVETHRAHIKHKLHARTARSLTNEAAGWVAQQTRS